MGRGFEIRDRSVGGEQRAFFADHPTVKLTRGTRGRVGCVFRVGGESISGELSGDPLPNEVSSPFDVAEREATRVRERMVVELANGGESRVGEAFQFGGGSLGKWHGKQRK